MTDTTLKIYMAAILLHLGLILMALSNLAKSVDPSSTSVFAVISTFSTLIAGVLLLWHLVMLLPTSEQS